MSTLEAALTELARVPPKDFTRTRTALVARLRDAGDVEAAARVKARRAPTISVWAVNRLAQDAEDDVDALISASEDLKAAQLGRRAHGDSLGRATRAHRAALDRLIRRVRSLLQEVGTAATHHLLLRIQMLLTAAAADPQARRALREGRLEQELAAPGFDVFGAARPTSTGGDRKRSSDAKPPRSPAAAPSEAARAADARRREHEEQRRLREAQRQQQLADAQATMDVAQAGAVVAEQQAADAKQALDALLDQVRHARQALRDRDADTRKAARAVAQARRALQAAGRRRAPRSRG
jgi:hypothetical protein